MERKRPDYENLSWSLWNERTSLQIDGLTFTYAWLFIATIPRRDWNYWQIWHDGLTTWQSLKDFEETSVFVDEMMKHSKDYAQVPGEEERRRAAAEREIHTFELEEPRDEQKDGIKLDSTKFNDNRVHRRYSQRFPVAIDIDGTLFRTLTVDVSMGGMRIADALPSTFSDTFEASIEKPDGTFLTLNCLMIKRTNAPLDRIRFIHDSSSEANLRTWLLSTPELHSSDGEGTSFDYTEEDDT